MDPPLRGSTSMRHNACTIREPIEPQEASPMQHEMHVLGIDIAKRVFHLVGINDRGKIGWCPSIAWMKGRRSDVDHSRVEPGVKVGLP